MKFHRLLICIMFVAAVLHAKEECDQMITIPCEKTYVLPEQITINSEGIFISFEDGVVLTPAIHTDQNGIYFTEVRNRRCDEEYWECGRCHYCNVWHYIFCRKCDYPRWGK